MIVVIPFNLPWEWSTDYTNQTAFVLGERNTVICYMWSDYLSIKEYLVKKRFPRLIKKYSKNIYLFYPILFIPFRRFKTITGLNDKLNIFLLNVLICILSFHREFKEYVLWIFDPQTEYLVHYFKKPWKIIYDCVDYYIGVTTSMLKRKEISRSEIKLTKEVDFAFANSMVLQKHLENSRNDIHLVPQGFRSESFGKYRHTVNTPILKRFDRPLIGFVGAVNYRIDYRLIFNLANKHPEWDFALWGPELQKELFMDSQKKYLAKLKTMKNLIFGKSDKKEIPGIVKQFDIGMIPYIPDDDFNKYCYPMKLFEFFYVGIPVVSIEIEELIRFPDLVKIGRSWTDWEKIITKVLSKPWPVGLKSIAKKYATENSWKNKVGIILRVIMTKSNIHKHATL